MKERGFTLIELVMMILVIGILAVAVIPRFLDAGSVRAREFLDQTLAVLRYAHKAAIAHRRTVCVDFTADSISLSVAESPGPASCTLDLASPGGQTPFRIVAGTGVRFASVPAGFTFDALGVPSAGQTIQILSGSVPAGSLTIEDGTGYVHR